MTAKSERKESAKPIEVRGLTFKCRCCEEQKPLSEMVVMPRYFPPVTACRGCATKMEHAVESQPTQEE
jgi:hypothetical protein